MQRLDDSRARLSSYSRIIDLKTRRVPIAGVTAYSSSVRERQMNGRCTYPQACTLLWITKSITALAIQSAASTVTAEDPLARILRALPDSHREGEISVQLTSIGIFPASLSPSVPLCPPSASGSFPYPSYRLCRPFFNPLLLRVVVQVSSQHADNVANWVGFVQWHSTAFLDILRKPSFLKTVQVPLSDFALWYRRQASVRFQTTATLTERCQNVRSSAIRRLFRLRNAF